MLPNQTISPPSVSLPIIPSEPFNPRCEASEATNFRHSGVTSELDERSDGELISATSFSSLSSTTDEPLNRFRDASASLDTPQPCSQDPVCMESRGLEATLARVRAAKLETARVRAGTLASIDGEMTPVAFGEQYASGETPKAPPGTVSQKHERPSKMRRRAGRANQAPPSSLAEDRHLSAFDLEDGQKGHRFCGQVYYFAFDYFFSSASLFLEGELLEFNLASTTAATDAVNISASSPYCKPD